MGARNVRIESAARVAIDFGRRNYFCQPRQLSFSIGVRALGLIKFVLLARSKIWNFRGRGSRAPGSSVRKNEFASARRSAGISSRRRCAQARSPIFPGERTKTSRPRTLWNLFETRNSHSAPACSPRSDFEIPTKIIIS